MICVSIVEPTLPKAIDTCREAVMNGADLIEVRFDLMDHLPEDLSPFSEIDVRTIATLRSEGQGGGFQGTPEEQSEFLGRASQYFDMVDIEMGSERPDLGIGTEVIASFHRFQPGMGSEQILEIMESCLAQGDVGKVAVSVDSVSDLHEVMLASIALRERKAHVLIGMGEMGAITRIRWRSLGNAFTFASLPRKRESAPGQLDLNELRRFSDGIIAGITGLPLSHSLSPKLHRAAFDHLGINGTYLTFQAEEEELEKLMEIVVQMDIRGINVTIPHKQAVIPLLNEVDDRVKRMGAVNTIVLRDGKTRGSNTDVDGVAGTFSAAGISPFGKRALVIGAGGASRAACTFLIEKGARVLLMNRTRERALSLVEDLPEVEMVNEGEAISLSPDIIINCTPLGMKGFPNRLPIDPSVFREGQFVMDTIYNPRTTRLMAEAQRRGAEVRSGIEMLIYQAIAAFQIWTGESPPFEVMARAIEDDLV